MAKLESQYRVHCNDDETPVEGWAILSSGKVDPKQIYVSRGRAELYAALHMRGGGDIARVRVTGTRIDRI